MLPSPLSSHPHPIPSGSPQHDEDHPHAEDDTSDGLGMGGERGPPITINELVQVRNITFS